MYTFRKSVPQTVELSVVPNHYSGRTKFRIGLLTVGMFSFLSLTIFVNHRENSNIQMSSNGSIAFVDNEFYFAYNLLMAAFAFSMIPLADFQVFEYNNPFWNVFKSLSTYGLLAEVESLLQFVYFNLHILWSDENYDFNEEEENLMVIFNLLILAVFRCIFLALLFYFGTKFLFLIIETRKLPSNYYVSTKWNIIEYFILHGFGYLLTTNFDQLETFQVCTAVAIYVSTYLYIRETAFWSIKRLYKTNVY